MTLAACLLALTLTACTAAETAVPAATAPPTAAPSPTAAPTAAPQATPLPYDDLSYVPEFGFQQKQTYQPDEYNRLYLDTYSFNDRTVLVGAEDETAALLEAGRDPGLGVRSLQARGITGQGVKIAIIDQSLLTDHPEISGAIAAYCETGIDSGLNEGTLHGPAVASILAGQTVGVAPGVQVYYMATPGAADSRPHADALRHILEYRAIMAMLKDAVDAMIAFQDAESGMFWQVVDKAGVEGNYLETSGSALFAYAVLKGVRLGYLPKRYTAYGEKAFYGTCDRHLGVGADGALQLGGICLVAGLGGATRRDGSLAYYFSEPIVENDAKGVGPLLLAYTEILAAQKQ